MIERVRGRRARAEIVDHLRAREPESSAALVALVGEPRRRTKVWVGRRSGKIVATFVLERWCFDRWGGTVFLDDLALADELARVIDKSSAWSIGGPVEGVEAVLRRLRRARGWVRVWFYWIPPQPPENADAFERNTAVTIRNALPTELEALVDLYALDEHSGAVTRRRLRHVVRTRLAHLRVAELDGRLVGVVFIPETKNYRILDLLFVHPEARGNRIGVALLIDAGIDAVIDGRGLCGARAMTNGLRVSHEETMAVGDCVVWAAADLRPPTRFRGHTRLRHLIQRMEGGVLTPPRPEASPYSVLPEQASRVEAE
jgi:GNAT superfamily N-acetyltransferase